MTVDAIPETPLSGVLKGQKLDGHAMFVWSDYKDPKPGQMRTVPYSAGRLKAYFISGPADGKCLRAPPAGTPYLELNIQTANLIDGVLPQVKPLGQKPSGDAFDEPHARVSDGSGSTVVPPEAMGFAVNLIKHAAPKDEHHPGTISVKLLATMEAPNQPPSWMSGTYDGPVCWSPAE